LASLAQSVCAADNPVLLGVSFEVGAGEVAALIGA
jgi:ABC-type multidrug transport system ATPase subunit